MLLVFYYLKGGEKMYATDFIYDGKNLSDFGWIICNFTDDK